MNQALRWCGLLLLGCGLLWCKPAHAVDVSCTASMTNAAFGSINPLASQTDTTATLSYTCTNSVNAARFARVCFSINDGVQGGGQMDPRQMEDSGTDLLLFQLYQDAAHSVVWGSSFMGTFGPLQVNLVLSPLGSSSGSATAYGRVLDGQVTAIPASYSDHFSGTETVITVNSSATVPPLTCSTVSAGKFAFTATATVAKQCLVSATTLDFGTTGVLTTNTPGTSSIDMQCSNTTTYNVGLNAGLNGGSNINNRKMALGSNRVSYQLYQDAGRTVVWGNTVGTNTVAGTGTGSVQTLTVYGTVPAQTTPPAGTYSDTITVKVTY